MKIDSSVKTASASLSNRVRPQPRTEDDSAPAASDEVKLSPLAEQLQVADSQPPIDSARVAEIKRAISEGRFTINASAIADRLLDTARQLVGSHRTA